MFVTEIRVTAFAPWLYRRGDVAKRNTEQNMDHTVQTQDVQNLICETLAEMMPSTAVEIAEATGLDPAAAGAQLEDLARLHRIMFNPLTKRFSLPKPCAAPDIAA